MGSEWMMWMVCVSWHLQNPSGPERDAILFCSNVAESLLFGFPPRGLGRCLLVDAPAVFASTWSAVRGILNEVTAGKNLGETMMKVIIDIWQLYVHEQYQYV